jgi:hypothetical protein
MAGAYIDDGCDIPGYIKSGEEQPNGERLYGDLNFVYRRAIRRETLTLDGEVKVAMADELTDPTCKLKAEDLACKFIVKKVSSWDLKNGKGEPVKVSLDALYHLHPIMFGRLYNIIRGWSTSDPKPDTAPEMSDEEQEKN